MIATPISSPEYFTGTALPFEAVKSHEYFHNFNYPSPSVSESSHHTHIQPYVMDEGRVPSYKSASRSRSPTGGVWLSASPAVSNGSVLASSVSIGSTLSSSGLQMHVSGGDVNYAGMSPNHSDVGSRLSRAPTDYSAMTIQPGVLGTSQPSPQNTLAFSYGPSTSSNSSELPNSAVFAATASDSLSSYPHVHTPAQVYPEHAHSVWHRQASENVWEGDAEPCHLAYTAEPSPDSLAESLSVVAHGDTFHSRNYSAEFEYGHPQVKQEPGDERDSSESLGDFHNTFLSVHSGDQASEATATSDKKASVDSVKARPTRTQHTPAHKVKFICEECNRGFGRLWNYRSHKDTHQHEGKREKPHKCQIPGCTLSFRRPTDLKRHLNSVHNKSKEFECRQCGAGFPRKDSLQRHESDGCPKRAQVKRRRLVTTAAARRQESAAAAASVAASLATGLAPGAVKSSMETSNGAEAYYAHPATNSGYGSAMAGPSTMPASPGLSVTASPLNSGTIPYATSGGVPLKAEQLTGYPLPGQHPQSPYYAAEQYSRYPQLYTQRSRSPMPPDTPTAYGDHSRPQHDAQHMYSSQYPPVMHQKYHHRPEQASFSSSAYPDPHAASLH